jgi:hypothetical protein
MSRLLNSILVAIVSAVAFSAPTQLRANTNPVAPKNGPTQFLETNHYPNFSCMGFPTSIDYKPIDYCYPNPYGSDYIKHTLEQKDGLYTLSTLHYYTSTCDEATNPYPDEANYQQVCSGGTTTSSIVTTTTTIPTKNYYTSL